MPELPDSESNAANDIFRQPPRALTAVAPDERHGMALVEQLHDVLDLHAANLKVLGYAGQINSERRFGRYGCRFHDRDNPGTAGARRRGPWLKTRDADDYMSHCGLRISDFVKPG